MRIGDYVSRISYNHDVIFKIERITDGVAELRGVDFRLLADAPLHDLTEAEREEDVRSEPLRQRAEETFRLIEQYRKIQHEKNRRALSPVMDSLESYFEVPGKVLHLDGDSGYLRKSMDLYGKFRVPAEGYYVYEPEMPETLYRLLPKVKPDIVVITGHDGVHKHQREKIYHLDSYKNSKNFVKAVKIARQYEKNRDVLTVVAGACQSHFEALLQAGANFASSPARILIHALDPVHIAAKCAYTSIKETVNMVDVFSHTVTGVKGIGGIESRGSYRIGLPNFKLKEQER